MSEIIKEILKQLPEDKISDACFEGANIVLYTKDKKFLFDNNVLIKKVVDDIKKRVELRPDPSICMDMEKAKKEIKKMIPEEAEIGEIIFDSQRSQVIIETEKPGVAIGKEGSILKEIRQKTLWVPIITRTPAIRSKLIENIRGVLYEHSAYRRKFLDKTGHRIYDGWIRGKKEEWVRVSFLGGARQVGRSCLLLQTPESRILLDCGINVAAEGSEQYPIFACPEFKIEEIDAIIVSHSHLDHCGLIPWLVKMGYKGPIYCTPPTRDVMALLQLDLIKIAKSEGKDPLYDVDDVREMVKHTITLEYEEVADITPDIRITLYNAGHIMGSAMIHLHIGNGLHNLLYTGDMKFSKTHLLEQAATSFPRLETLIIESTYGGKDNNPPSREEQETYLANIVKETIGRKGKVLIPVLGVGRAQEIMLILYDLVKKGELEEIPVYVDGMVWDVTAIHTAYPEYLNRNIRKYIFHKDENPFLHPMFKEVASPKERKQVIEETGAGVILATSGMLVGGPSVEYLKNLGDNPRNTLVFVAYQGEGSLGRRIQKGERDFIFPHGQKQEVLNLKMEVHTIEGFSGHSSRKELMNYLYRCDPKPKKIIVNHGENSKCLDLASGFHKTYRIETICPRNLEAVRIK